MIDPVKTELRKLTRMVDQFLPALDRIMSEHSVPPVTRGQRVARIANQLDMANQIAKRYGLGKGLPKVKKGPKVNA